MKKIVVGVLLLVAIAGFSFERIASAYMSDIAILERKDISKLSDDQLISTFIDVIVEMEASKTFHTTSGFTPKEYDAYKNLLRYRIELLMDIHKRGLEPPSLDK